MALGQMSPLRAHLRWRAQRLGQFARYSLLRRVYRETNHDIGNSLIVAGAARSGTTWLASIMQSQLACRLMFEPFHSGKVAAFHGHHYFQYMRPEEKCPTLYDYSKRVLSGDIRHAWVDRRVDRLRSHYRLVKEIRANLFLKWLADAFPQVPILFIIRHPCAVVLSRMKLDWATDSDIAPFLAQPKLVEDYLSDKLDFINGIEAWITYQPLPVWRLEGGYVSLREHLGVRPGVNDPVGPRNPTLANDPDHQWLLRSSFDLPARQELDLMLRRVAALRLESVPGYTAFDARWGWKMSRQVEVSVTLQNLFDRQHAEFGARAGRSEFERAIFLKLLWRQ